VEETKPTRRPNLSLELQIMRDKTGMERMICSNVGIRINTRTRQQVKGALQSKEFCPKSYSQSDWW
jgi:hypothetical protein